ncbi:hypothetical protein FJY94_02975 [Candidatus Kaiserbacteria bacterium]|nr:hypothetical protein [Candidatus Kaiserbacteria bacterium]
MRRHDREVIKRLQADRLAGRSIPELAREYGLPKTTVWHNVQDIVLPEQVRKSIRSRMGGSRAGMEREWASAHEKALKILIDSSVEHMWAPIFAALYWSEGTKKTGFVFTNTDADMIRVFLKILRERLGVVDGDLDILIRTSKSHQPLACRRHWAGVTGLPLSKIRNNHDDVNNKGKSVHGMCRITLRKGSRMLKLTHCLIRELTGKMLAPEALTALGKPL